MLNQYESVLESWPFAFCEFLEMGTLVSKVECFKQVLKCSLRVIQIRFSLAENKLHIFSYFKIVEILFCYNFIYFKMSLIVNEK